MTHRRSALRLTLQLSLLGLPAVLAACGSAGPSGAQVPTPVAQAAAPDTTPTAADVAADNAVPGGTEVTASGPEAPVTAASPATEPAAAPIGTQALGVDVACDSTGDDLAAIRSKLSAQSTVTLSGTCRIGSTLSLPGGKTLAGGRLVATTPLATIISASGDGATVRDMVIDGARSKIAIANNGRVINVLNVEAMNLTDFGVRLVGGTGSRVSGFKGHDISGLTGASAVLLNKAPRTVIENVTAYNIMPPNPTNPSVQPPDGNGVFIANGSDGTTVTGVTGSKIGRRLVKIQSSGITVRNVYATDVGHSAVQVQLATGYGGPVRGCRLYNINATRNTNGQYGIMFEQHVDDCIVDGFNFTGMSDTGIDVRGGITNVTFKNGTVKNTARWGARVENSTSSGTRTIKFDNVTFDGCYRSGGSAFAIRPNSTYGAVNYVTLNGSRFLNQTLAMEAAGTGHTFTNNNFGSAQVKITSGTGYTASNNTAVNGTL